MIFFLVEPGGAPLFWGFKIKVSALAMRYIVNLITYSTCGRDGRALFGTVRWAKQSQMYNLRLLRSYRTEIRKFQDL